MEIKISQAQANVPVTVFHIDGRINLGNTEELEETARKAYENGTRNLVLDFSAVPSLTSAALRSIHYIYKLLGSGAAPEPPAGSPLKSAHLKLANPDPYVRKVLTTAGFDRFMEIHDSVQDAISSF